METDSNKKSAGILYAAMAYTLWGLLPLYWKSLKQLPVVEIISHRIFWCFVFVLALILLSRKWDRLINVMKNKKNLLIIFICSILITINWSTYIWAVIAGHIVESSLGYYINPLFSVFLGMVFLKEKMNAYKSVSLLIASTGVVIMTVQYGKVPWIAITLAVSFGLYGLLKKLLQVESIIGLALETSILAPFTLAYLVWGHIRGTGVTGSVSIPVMLMLLGAGILTAIPLLWFAKAAKRVELSTIGFLQYISPSINLLLGIFVFKEAFTSTHFISFGFIWAALMLYSLSQTGLLKYFPRLVQKA